MVTEIIKNSAKATIASLTIFTLIAPSLPVYAVEDTTDETTQVTTDATDSDDSSTNKERSEESKKERDAALEEKRQELVEYRCAVVTSKIDLFLTRYENNKKRHHRIYANMVVRIADILQRLEEAGYDVSEEMASLNELQSKIDKLESDFTQFKVLMQAAKELKCEDGEEEFKDTIEAARVQLKVVREDVTAVRDYYQNTLKPQLIELKAEVKNDRREAKNDERTRERDDVDEASTDESSTAE